MSQPKLRHLYILITIILCFTGEILQILLLYFHRGFDGDDVIELLKIFTAHKFGHNRFGDKVDTAFVDSIGHLEAVLIVYLLDLPALTETIEDLADLDQHPIWKSPSLVQDLDKNIGSNLGINLIKGPTSFVIGSSLS